MADHDGHTINVGTEAVGIDTDVIRRRRTAIGKEATDALCDEVDRLRAELVMAEKGRREDAATHMTNEVEVDRLRADVDRLQRASTPMGMLEQIREAIGPEAAQRARDGAGGWVGLVVEVDRLRAKNAELRDLLAKALPWIDPTGWDENADPVVDAIREALGEGS